MAGKSFKDDKKQQLSLIQTKKTNNDTSKSMAPPPFQLKAGTVQMKGGDDENATTVTPAGDNTTATTPTTETEGTPTAETTTDPTTTTEETNTLDAADVTLTFGANADESAVPATAITIIKEILAAAGEANATISSTARDAEDQARAMFNNLEVEGGVASERDLYGSYGDQVIDTYEASKAEGKTATQIKADMQAKIEALGPSNVSKHCADGSVLTVVDIAPSSVTNKTEFIAAVEADSRVTKFLQPPKDKGYHLEMPR